MRTPSLLLVFIVLLTACSSKEKKTTAKSSGPPPPPRVEAWVVTPKALSENIELPGNILANEETGIQPEISGRLTYLNTAEGRNVGRGALIAKIYDGDLKAQLNKLNVQLKVQEQTIKRYEELLKINGVSQQEYDMIKLQSNNIRADMAIVQSNIRRTEIRAPFSGTLGLRMVSPGAYVTPQTVLTTIRQSGDLKLDFTLPERYTSRLNTGQLVNFTSEGSDKVYQARVTARESGISETDRSLRIRARVINPDRDLLPGNFATVRLAFEPDPSAIMIPSQAVIPQARGKQVAIYRDGKAAFEDVITGVRDSAMVQITNGLKAGDTIILTGLMRLKPNDKVTIAKTSQ